ncbi:alpha-hydroxy-acid oxidizing protein [Candidatus Woesearchaeota archaeon]|nr:alpha-hydroxy-acid oxidizing protein [Candidatus Woesearchaeota archaeon]
MTVYECSVCGYKYKEKNNGEWDSLPQNWECPVCDSTKPYFKTIEQDIKIETEDGEIEVEIKKDQIEQHKGYLKEFRRSSDDVENTMTQIHEIADTGKSLSEPMRTRKPLISWDDILIKGAQIAKLPLAKDANVSTETIIGPNAKHPLRISTPIIISHMSFGALSKEVKTALAKGSAQVKTAICSGEGGILPEEKEAAYKYIFEYVPNQYSVTDENLKNVDAVEIKFGQATKPGMGGHLPGDKVTEEIAKIRQKPIKQDILSPSYFTDITTKEELKAKVGWLREKTAGKPIGVKIAAGNIEDDLEIITYAQPDFITIDGRGGATGSSPKYIKDSTSVPTLYALARARYYLDQNNINSITLIITGGLRISPDFAKALALGADAVAIATSAMIAAGCQQYRICNSGKCPVGIATHDPELRKRLKIDVSAKRIENFLKVSTEELKDFARITGKNNIHDLDESDLCTVNTDISNHTKIQHVGGNKHVKN